MELDPFTIAIAGAAINFLFGLLTVMFKSWWDNRENKK